MSDSRPPLTIQEFQHWIDRVYGQKDRERGIEGTFLWFHEEVGELTRAAMSALVESESLAIQETVFRALETWWAAQPMWQHSREAKGPRGWEN